MNRPVGYREKLYSTYVSAHAFHLYGEATVEGIERQFPVWKGYYEKFLPQDKSAKILEVGCGNGGLLLWLQRMGYVNASGIDISPEQVEVAKKLGVKVVEQGDIIEWMKDKKELYDMIFARDVIEHFRKDEIFTVVESCHKALKDGGILVLYTLNSESPFGCRYRYGDFTHELGFTRASLAQILRVAGFTEVAFYPTGPVPKGIKSAIRFLLWKMIETILRFYMLVETGSGDGIYTQTIICMAKK